MYCMASLYIIWHHYVSYEAWVHPVRLSASLSSASLSLTALLSHFGYQMYPMHTCSAELGGCLSRKCSYRISLVNCHSHKHHWDQLQITKLILRALMLDIFGHLLLSNHSKVRVDIWLEPQDFDKSLSIHYWLVRWYINGSFYSSPTTTSIYQ